MKTITALALLPLSLALAVACGDSEPDESSSTGGRSSTGGGSMGGAGETGGRSSGGADGGSATGGRASATGGRTSATGGRTSGGAGGTMLTGGAIGNEDGGSAGESSGGAEAADAQEPVPLGASSTFALLASAQITNIPTSSITGDIGLTPDAAANITGFSMPGSCPEVTGNVYGVDATGPACVTVAPVVLEEAKTDAGLAFANARAATRGTPIAISGDLHGLTLYPGLYESGTSLEISPGGLLYLDAQGDDDAVFILRSATSITTESTSEVVLQNGAHAGNVYWTAGSTVTLGTSSIMKGTMLAGTSIAVLTGAHLEGRVLNHGPAAEAVTLDACTIVVPSP